MAKWATAAYNLANDELKMDDAVSKEREKTKEIYEKASQAVRQGIDKETFVQM